MATQGFSVLPDDRLSYVIAIERSDLTMSDEQFSVLVDGLLADARLRISEARSQLARRPPVPREESPTEDPRPRTR